MTSSMVSIAALTVCFCIVIHGIAGQSIPRNWQVEAEGRTCADSDNDELPRQGSAKDCLEGCEASNEEKWNWATYDGTLCKCLATCDDQVPIGGDKIYKKIGIGK